MDDDKIEKDEFTEIYDANVPRVDLVGSGANGLPFLIAKSGAGLMPPDAVRDLISKHTHQDEVVTVSGSPAAITRMIYDAAQRQKQETPVSDVIKADVTDPDEPLPDAEELAPKGATGDPSDPESPAWEAVDAEHARQAVELTVALRRMVQRSLDREVVESASTGDYNDAQWQLGDVLSAIDCILAVLAPFAVTEQAEADERESAVTKAGRVLSSANEDRIRGAVDALSQVLASLPAPTTDDGAAVTKEMAVTDTATEATEVEKAKGDPMVPIYNDEGKLVGMVDAKNVVPIQNAPTGDEGDDIGAGEAVVEAAAAPGEDAAQVPGTNTVAAPAPAAPAAPDDQHVAKSQMASMQAAFTEVLAPVMERLAKQAELEDAVQGLKEQFAKMAAMPDDRKSPLLTGAGVIPGDGPTAQADEFAELRKAVDDAKTPTERQAAQQTLAYAEIKRRFAS